MAQSTPDDLGRVAGMLDDHQLRLTISGRFALEQVGEAQSQLEARRFSGQNAGDRFAGSMRNAILM